MLERLKTELPGIAARCVAAYHRARDRGRLIQPRSSERLEAEIVKSSDPFTLFMQETFIADPTGTVLCSRAFFAFRNWCDRRESKSCSGGPDGGGGSIVKQNFQKLPERRPWLRGGGQRPRPHGDARRYAGLRFLNKAEQEADYE